MPKTYTRLELRTRLDQLCDIENDAHLSTAEKNSILDSAMSETWDLICDSGLGEKYVKSVTFNTVANQTEYPFSTVAPSLDLYRITKLYAVENGTRFRPLQKISPSEILSFKAPAGVTGMKLYYIPICPKTTADADTFDGVNGWEEHVLMTAACAIKMKREESYDLFYKRKMELTQRIKSMGLVDFGEPPRVAHKRGRYGSFSSTYPLVGASTVNAYVVRGDKIELYSLDGYPGY